MPAALVELWPAYHVSVRESAAGANKRHLTLWNPAGSGRVLRVFRVTAAGAPTAAVTGLVIPLTVLRITSAPTGGSAATINKARSASASLPAGIVAATGATGGATEEPSFIGTGTVTGEETQAASQVVLYQAQEPLEPLTLAEGEGVLVKQGTLASAGAVNITLQFSAGVE